MKPTHGGKRPKAGRPAMNHIQYQRRIKPEHVKLMDAYLNELKASDKK